MTDPKNNESDLNQNTDPNKELEMQDSLSKDLDQGAGEQDNLLFAIPAVSSNQTGMLNVMDADANPFKDKVSSKE